MTTRGAGEAAARQLYHRLWQEADALHRQEDPCCFSNGVCAEGEPDGCCLCELHRPGRPCHRRSLGCKIHLCQEARHRHPQLAAALDRIEQEARRGGLPVELFDTVGPDGTQ